jgi:hypothetical protein
LEEKKLEEELSSEDAAMEMALGIKAVDTSAADTLLSVCSNHNHRP